MFWVVCVDMTLDVSVHARVTNLGFVIQRAQGCPDDEEDYTEDEIVQILIAEE